MSTMNRLLRTTFTFASALVLVTAAQAAEYVRLKNGTLIKGQAVSFDDATQTLKFQMEDGTTSGFKLDELDKRSVYLVNQSRVPKDDATKQIRIGNLARDAELFAQAVRNYDYAEKADPSRKPEIDQERAKLRQLAAAYGMKKAQDAITKRDIPEAEKWLLKIVDKVPDEPQAKEAAAMLEQYYTKTREEREAKAEAKATEQLRKDLQPGKKSYEDMVKKTQQGLTTKTTGNKSTSAWESAINDGERALALLDKLTKKYTDSATRETLSGYREMVVNQMVELHLHLASALTTRSSYNKALAEVNQALALDPKNERALSARARIEQASAERGGIW
jgi:tetratricopeptide (TPR) repeat protein